MKRLIFFFTAFCFTASWLTAQDEILMTIGNEKITKAEFERIYHKNNSSIVYENKSPRDYLELFINFKLKVMEAKAQGYDTMSAFIKELDGYRDQLAKPYLQDKDQRQQMLEEAYYRTAHEVSASHIHITISPSASPADTLEAYNRIMTLRNRILAGESFEDIALAASEDRSVKNNKGYLGWFAAFRMVYPFEDIAYKTPVGQISMPVRTRFGYHIIRNNGIRPAIGEISLAHIMLRARPGADSAVHQAAAEKIDACYSELKKGGNFGEMARKYSDDQSSAKYDGRLRWISSGELPPDIEEVVYAMKDSGQITEPLHSEFGYHIFQFLGKRPVQSFEELKPQLEEKIANDERQKNTDLLYVEKLKKEYGFIAYPENLAEVVSTIDSSIYDGIWEPALAGELIDPVFTVGDKDHTQLDFGNFVKAGNKYSRKESVEVIWQRKYDEFVTEMVLDYEKDKLEGKYPEFRYLMDEYHDGILLFNITDDKVWTKAVKDTAGLEQFFKMNRKNYIWQTRADVSKYSTKDSTLAEKIMLNAPLRVTKKMSVGEFNALVSGQDTLQHIEVLDQKLEKGNDKTLDAMDWKKGAVKTYSEKGKTQVLYINGILKPQKKQLKESRGLVTADYQNLLEKQWIQELRKKYPVAIDEKVFETIK